MSSIGRDDLGLVASHCIPFETDFAEHSQGSGGTQGGTPDARAETSSRL